MQVLLLIMKLLEKITSKCFSWKTADLELRRFRNDLSIWDFVHASSTAILSRIYIYIYIYVKEIPWHHIFLIVLNLSWTLLSNDLRETLLIGIMKAYRSLIVITNYCPYLYYNIWYWWQNEYFLFRRYNNFVLAVLSYMHEIALSELDKNLKLW